MSKALFLMKRACSYGYSAHQSSGLLNSVSFVADMLRASGVKAKVVQVVDNNDIDCEVYKYRPTHVFIEALWVVPEKFEVLRRLHPEVKWVIHLHSDLPFLATEGIAISWIKQYLKQRNVSVAFNTPKAADAALELFGRAHYHKIFYLPNYYPVVTPHKVAETRPPSRVVEVGCFGAIRPLKNQLVQAVAAIRFADRQRKVLRFHVNSTRCEQNGDSILRNLRALFDDTTHQLIEHGWLDHHDFLELMDDMDIALSVSFSETFCITAADAVAMSVPLLCSVEIPWASEHSIVHHVTDSEALARRMSGLTTAVKNAMSFANRNHLMHYSSVAKKVWLDFLSGRD